MGYEGKNVKVNDLNPGSRNVNLTVKVLSVGEEREVTSRRDGSRHRVADALVGDETGTVLMTLWDENIDKIREKEDSVIDIKNGYITVFRDSMRLSIGRYGSIEDSNKTIEEINEENNISEKRVERPRSYRRRFSRRKY